MGHAPFDHLVKQFARLPGLGPRSAKRVALHLLSEGRGKMEEMAQVISETATLMRICPSCGNLDMVEPCTICRDINRDKTLLCIVASIADLWAIERAGTFRGLYHVLGGLLSAINGVTPEKLNVVSLQTRLDDTQIEEIILALSATVDGQTTAHYVSDMITRHHNRIKISRLAHGMPVGGELDYLDDGTIMSAFKSRRSV
jgi:recombination protein RecR